MSDRTHPDDEQLAALLDGSLLESDAGAVRQHLERCGPCQSRTESFKRVVRDLKVRPPADHALVNDTLQRIQRPRGASFTRFLVPALTLPVAAALLLVVWSGDPPEMVPRGPEISTLASVHLELFQLDRATAQPRKLSGGEHLMADQVSLAVALDHLPGGVRHVAVYARDAGGRVTWLLPIWTETVSRPGCLAIPATAGALPASKAVTLEEVRAGRLEIALLVFDAPCSVPDLDARLERGLKPEVGKVEGLLQFSSLQMEIEVAP